MKISKTAMLSHSIFCKEHQTETNAKGGRANIDYKPKTESKRSFYLRIFFQTQYQISHAHAYSQNKNGHNVYKEEGRPDGEVKSRFADTEIQVPNPQQAAPHTTE